MRGREKTQGDFFSEGSDPFDSVKVADLKKGKSVALALKYTPLSKGRKKLLVYADPIGELKDMDRSNNFAELKFKGLELKGMDLVLTRVFITMGGATPKAATLNVSFIIANCGSKPSGAFSYKAYLTAKAAKIRGKDTKVVEENVASLKPGETIEVNTAVRVKKLGKKFYFQGIADDGDAVTEVNEDNNKVVKTILKKEL
ncbi:MAG TPA: CARDB domain-containing protein [Acidobacteriota bacterium]|nr:CARDB domain-containing protein [Acidobacteriota bacterium]